MKTTIIGLFIMFLLQLTGNTAEIKWQDSWGKDPSGAIVASTDSLKIEGTSKQSYGCVYAILTLDMNKKLVVDVEGTTGKFYIIVKHRELTNGYVKLQPDTDNLGKHIYDLKQLTGMKGEKEVELQLGISSTDGLPNKGVTVTFNSIEIK